MQPLNCGWFLCFATQRVGLTIATLLSVTVSSTALAASLQSILLDQDPRLEQTEGVPLSTLPASELRLSQATPSPIAAEAEQLYLQANEQLNRGQAQEAVALFEQARQLFAKAGDVRSEGLSLAMLGVSYRRLGNYPRALELSEQALIRLRQAGDRASEASTLLSMATTYSYLGQLEKAFELGEQGLAIHRELGSPEGEADALNTVGQLYGDTGQYDKAVELMTRSLQIRRDIGDRRGEGLMLGNLAVVRSNQGQYAEALDLYQQSLVIRREIGDRGGEGTLLNAMARLYQDLGQPNQAVAAYQQALVIRQEIKDRRGEGITFNGLGSAYTQLKDYPQAERYYQQALVIRRELGDRRGEGITLNNLAELHRLQSRHSKALEFYQQSLVIRQEVGDRIGEGRTLNNIAATYVSLNDYDKALEFYQQALKLIQTVGDRPNQAQALANLGNLYAQIGNLPQAEVSLYQAIAILEDLRPGLSDTSKVSLFDTQKTSYRRLEEVLIDQGKFAAALEVSERGRARAFVELIASRLKDQATVDLTSVSQPPSFADMQQIARQQQATLVAYSIIPGELLVDDRTQIIDAELFIWVISPTGSLEFRQVDMKTLWPKLRTNENDINKFEQLVLRSRSDIGVRSRGFRFQENPNAVARAAAQIGDMRAQNDDLQQLHRLLIEPIAEFLPKNEDERVIFIPHESLFLVPFPALQDAEGRYLIEKHTLLTAPSIQILDLTRQARDRLPNQPGEILLVGNPTMPKVHLTPDQDPVQLVSLPGAEREAQTIGTILNSQPLLGGQATEAVVRQRMQTARLIHLATHGLLDDVEGLGVPGALALAPAGPDDGLLTASEILNLRLQAELVVLSACDTGLGKITGDGVIGLSRSLIAAGIPSVVVSLWKVPDDATAALMTAFYENLQQTPNKATALRQAMLTTLSQYPNPVDWAAFTLIGEAQ